MREGPPYRGGEIEPEPVPPEPTPPGGPTGGQPPDPGDFPIPIKPGIKGWPPGGVPKLGEMPYEKRTPPEEGNRKG